jgi:hypothetical protein
MPALTRFVGNSDARPLPRRPLAGSEPQRAGPPGRKRGRPAGYPDHGRQASQRQTTPIQTRWDS